MLMTEIYILGAGVMGTALAVPAAARQGNRVTLVGSPLDDAWIDAVQQTRLHPTLLARVPDSIEAIRLSQLDESALARADVIVLGVSSPGIDWVTGLLDKVGAAPRLLALVTKGLAEHPDSSAPPLTYADSLAAALPGIEGRLVGIGGPCIARELALRFPTRVTFASRDIQHAVQLRELLQTDYYRITTHTDVVAVEACAALKNFLCIGVSAMFSAHPLEDSYAKNPLAALYNQAVLELQILSRWISAASTAGTAGAASTAGTAGTAGTASTSDVASASSAAGAAARSPGAGAVRDVAFDLAGMGDLHVTVGGGRNSRLGRYLGQGRRIGELLETELAGVTVEGVDTGRRLLPGFQAGCAAGTLQRASLPLTAAILRCIEHDTEFEFDFADLPD